MAIKHEYLVFIDSPCSADDENPCSVFHKIMTADEIFDRMDMSDCSGEEIVEMYLLRDDAKFRMLPAEFHGTWHDFNDPLKMEIEVEGITVDVGYGTDH